MHKTHRSLARYLFLVLLAALFSRATEASVVLSPDAHEYQVLPMAAVPEMQGGCLASADSLPKEITHRWLGMVDHEGCTTLTKYSTLKALGASGMIVLSGDSIEYTASDSFYVVPVEAETYNSLMAMYQQSKRPPTVKIAATHRGALPLVQIMYIIFLVLMIFVFPTLFERLDEPRLKIVKPKELSTVAIKAYSEIVGEERKYEECPICFEKFEGHDFIRALQCSHYYHCKCIDPWLLSRSSRCPVCNHELSFT